MAALGVLEAVALAFAQTPVLLTVSGNQATGRIDLPGGIGTDIFVDGPGLELANGAVVVDGLPERGRLDACARGQHVRPEVEEGDVGAGQEAAQPSFNHQRQKRAPKHEAVEPGQHGRDEGTVALHARSMRSSSGSPPRFGRLPALTNDTVLSVALQARARAKSPEIEEHPGNLDRYRGFERTTGKVRRLA